jgi:hypothetical protein
MMTIATTRTVACSAASLLPRKSNLNLAVNPAVHLDGRVSAFKHHGNANGSGLLPLPVEQAVFAFVSMCRKRAPGNFCKQPALAIGRVIPYFDAGFRS